MPATIPIIHTQAAISRWPTCDWSLLALCQRTKRGTKTACKTLRAKLTGQVTSVNINKYPSSSAVVPKRYATATSLIAATDLAMATKIASQTTLRSTDFCAWCALRNRTCSRCGSTPKIARSNRRASDRLFSIVVIQIPPLKRRHTLFHRCWRPVARQPLQQRAVGPGGGHVAGWHRQVAAVGRLAHFGFLGGICQDSCCLAPATRWYWLCRKSEEGNKRSVALWVAGRVRCGDTCSSELQGLFAPPHTLRRGSRFVPAAGCSMRYVPTAWQGKFKRTPAAPVGRAPMYNRRYAPCAGKWRQWFARRTRDFPDRHVTQRPEILHAKAFDFGHVLLLRSRQRLVVPKAAFRLRTMPLGESSVRP